MEYPLKSVCYNPKEIIMSLYEFIWQLWVINYLLKEYFQWKKMYKYEKIYEKFIVMIEIAIVETRHFAYLHIIKLLQQYRYSLT